ncbi:hypothetical protein EW146_g242 [Bondarzewia mesenterica]|uniref:J domain-containing protein n=1 Tax=Bondarzewia mesenterica TaxID=1095465 RepID=A0A4S4M7H9_9AGAM|nr:hypothetical protein EW146_g242 [Bondarzewia mesenterica]
MTREHRPASDYFYLPIDDEQVEQDEPLPPHAKHIQWDETEKHIPSYVKDSEACSSRSQSQSHSFRQRRQCAAIAEILAENDLYEILGVRRAKTLDKMELRRAYISRSKACHPDKFPDNPEATLAFQKLSVAYDVLSCPASKRVYDSHPDAHEFSNTGANSSMRAEETLRSVVIGVFNDFLDGDMEMVHTLLRAMNDINPSLRLGEEGIESVLLTLQAIRERALTCRVLTYTLLGTLSHLLETHASLAKLSYLSIRPRVRLTLRLVRITLGLPIALEDAVHQHRRARARSRARRRRRHEHDIGDFNDAVSGAEEEDGHKTRGQVLPRRVLLLIEGLVVVLERIERVLQ